MKWFWILLALTAGLLYLTNPTMDDFQGFIKEESRIIIQDEATVPGLGDALADAASDPAQDYVESVTEYEDYYFFSTYKVNLAPRTITKRQWHFLGIGGSFINLSRFYD